MNNKYADLKTAILAEILAGRTTDEMSRFLGFSFDKYRRWLDNTKILKWDEFCDLCEKAGLDLEKSLMALMFPFGEYTEVKDFFSFLKMRNGFESNQVVADKLNFHISVIKRYSQRETIPDAETIFRMIDFRPNYLTAFLKELFGVNPVNPFLQSWIAQDGVRGSIYTRQQHICSIIEIGVSLDKYSERTVSSAEWLSQHFGFSISDVQKHLEILVAAKMLVKSGDDHYQVTSYTTNMPSKLHEAIPMLQSLNQVMINRLDDMKEDPKATPKPGIISHRIYSTSIKTAEKIAMIVSKAESEIANLLEDGAGPKEEVFCMLLEILPLIKKEGEK